MSNEPRVRAVAVSNGWEGHFRKLGKAGWFAVMQNGVEQLFASEDKAKLAAYEAMNRYHFGAGILRDGEKAGSACDEAEKLFGCVVKDGRKIDVVRR